MILYDAYFVDLASLSVSCYKIRLCKTGPCDIPLCFAPSLRLVVYLVVWPEHFVQTVLCPALEFNRAGHRSGVQHLGCAMGSSINPPHTRRVGHAEI